MGCVSSLPSEHESINTQSATNSIRSSSVEQTPKNRIPVLTRETLDEHTLQCEELETAFSSISTISSSGDRLKNIGDELLSMRFNSNSHKFKQYEQRSPEKSRKASRSITLSETPIPNDYSPPIAVIPKYYRIASDSHKIKTKMSDFDKEIETDSDDQTSESGENNKGNPFSHHHSKKSLTFPDVLLFS